MKRSLLGLAALLVMTAFAQAGPLTPTRYLDFNGVRIAAYESSGNSGASVLLIHGNTAAADYFEKVLLSPLACEHRIVAIDLPGFGHSDNAPIYNIGSISQAIAFAAQQLGVDHGVVVGWSLGGDLALQSASLLPFVKGYLLIGTAPLGFAPDLPAPLLTPDQSYAGAAVNFGFIANLSQAQISDYVTAFFRPGFNDIPQYLYDDGNRTDPATRAAVAVAAAGFDPTFQDEVATAKNLKVPLALLLGGQDAFVNPAYLAGLAPQIPSLWQKQIITIPRTGHAVQWERPVIFLALLRAFLHDIP